MEQIMSDDTLLGQLADEYIREVRKGKLPDIEEYAVKHPELADRIRELFPTLLLLEGMSAAEGPVSVESPDPSGLSPGNLFGHYRIDREIGRGGMGIVYEASHLLLEKKVALKVLPVRPFMDATHLERFFREARTAAGLHHTNIVPVFDVGQVIGIPYYAMQYIEGRSLGTILHIMQSSVTQETAIASSTDSTIDTETGPQSSSGQEASFKQENLTSRFFADPSLRTRAGLPEKLDEYFRWVADMGVQAAEGLAHAHERMVIHRDIKPSNLIIDNKGVLWITDFGLARRIEDPAVTQSGTLIGTPRYMSPEQAEAARHPVDQRSDIYSLGATLYELLTCRPVFEGRTPHDVISQIITREPVAPRRLNSEIPKDLSTIVMKAMAKRLEDRYQSASQFTEDLNRWLRMEPIKARRIGPVGRTIRWCRRNPKLAAVTATAGIIILALSGIFYAGLMKENAETRLAYQSENEALLETKEALKREEVSRKQAEAAEQNANVSREEAEESRMLAEIALKQVERERESTRAALEREKKARSTAELNSYAANLSLADISLRSKSFADAEQLLSACNSDLRGWEWQHLKLRANPALATIRLDSIPTQLTLSSDGSRVLWLSEEANEIRAAEIRTQKQFLLQKSTGMTVVADIRIKDPPYVIAFSRDSELIARTLWKNSGFTKLSDTSYKAISIKDKVAWNPLRNILEIASDLHSEMISSTEFYRAGVWEGEFVFDYINIFGNVISVVFNPDGTRFAAWTWDGKIRVCDTESGKILCSLPDNSNAVTSVAFSPDGDSIAVGYYDRSVRLWRVPSGNSIAVLQGHTEPVSSLAFQPDGKQIASGSYGDKTLRLWDPFSGKLLRIIEQIGPRSLAFSPDGELIAAGGNDNNVHVINAASGEEFVSLSGHDAPVTSVIFNAGGTRVISGSSDNTIRFWDISSVSYVRKFEIPGGRVGSALWNPDSRHIAVNISTWESGPQTIDPDRESAVVWDVLSGEMVSISYWPAKQPGWRHVLISPDASKVATVHNDVNEVTDTYANTEIQLLNLTPGSEPIILSGRNGPINHTAFSPDGKTFVSAEDNKTITLWDTSSGKLLRTISGHKEWSASLLKFSSDGYRLVSASSDKTLRTWDVATGELLAILRGHEKTITKAIFSPDSSLVLSSSNDKTVRVWDSLTGKEYFSFSCSNSDVIFNSDGSLIYAGCGDGTLSLWDVKTGRMLNSSKSNTVSFRSLALSPDQNRLIAGVGNTIKIWDADSLTPLLAMSAHDSTVRSVAFSPDGSMVLSVGYGKVKVWKSKRLD